MREQAALERNLRLYPWHQLSSQTLFWGPIFFLYFSERFPVDEVLRLGAIYYVSVVVLEVPSGWFSDRVSRVATLRIANATMACSQLLFVFGGERYEAFVAAQMLLALGYAFRSGTDTSFHFDTLFSLQRPDEFGEREAWIHRNTYLAIAASALAGGALGLLDLRLAYLAQAIACGFALLICLLLREPPRREQGYAPASFWRQLASCIGYARQPFLAWIFAYVVLMTTTAHIPWEFAQPYVALVFGEAIDAVERTPLATGVLHAMIAVAGALAAAHSIRLRDRLGVSGALLGVTGVQTLLIVAMAVTLHPAVAVLLVIRSVQPAVSDVIVSASIVPQIPQAQRATYQSLHSFAGRLGFAGVLYLLSNIGEPGAIGDARNVEAMLRAAALLTAAGVLALVTTARAVRS